MSKIRKNPLGRMDSGMKCLRSGLVLILVSGLFMLLYAQTQLSVYIEEVLVIGDSHEDLLYQRPGLTVDDGDNIYITDLRNNLIRKFDRIGEFIKETGLKGRRPVGLQGPSLIKYHNKKLYVSEASSPGILVYNQDLEYEREIPIPFTITDMHIISDVRIAVSALKREYEEGRAIYCIYIYDIETEETENIIYARGRRLSMMNMVNFVVDRRGEFILAYNWEDKTEKLDSEGEILWTQSLLDRGTVRMREEKDPRPAFGEYPVEAVYKGIALDNRGYILVLGGHLSENPNRDVYILRENGQYLTTFTLPEPAHAIHMDRNNFLYTRSSKGTSFRKYALKYFYE